GGRGGGRWRGAKVCGGGKGGALAAAAVVFSSTAAVPGSVSLATARSGLPSPLKSPTATAKGPPPAAKVCRGAKAAFRDTGFDRLTVNVLSAWKTVLPRTGTAMVAVV